MQSYITSSKQQFEYYKELGEKAFNQLSDEQLFWKASENDNSIAIIVNHLKGNMLSRWTNFLTEDGEKEWRQRDQEFEAVITSRDELLKAWEEGWTCLFNALDQVNDQNIESILYIRNQGHTVVEAINRQLCHYAYHVGQIVLIGKILKKEHWQSLSIPKGESKIYNQDKFSKEKEIKHFTSEFLNKKE